MNNFPENLTPDKKHLFKNMLYIKHLEMFREDIFIHMLNENENDPIDIDQWCRKKINNDWEKMEKILESVINELKILGWKCKISYGGTCLFIYSSDIQPPMCYDDNF